MITDALYHFRQIPIRHLPFPLQKCSRRYIPFIVILKDNNKVASVPKETLLNVKKNKKRINKLN